MKKLFTIFFAFAASVGTLFADKVKIGDLYYSLNSADLTATVVKENKDYPFWTTQLSAVNIPASVTYNGQNYSVTRINHEAFFECSMTSITIPHSVTSIGSSAFYRCRNLTSLTIPSSVSDIGIWVVSECTNLTLLSVENGNPIYDSRENCNAIIETATNRLVVASSNTTIPHSVTSIDNDAFYACDGLTTIVIPNTITNIDRNIFPHCDSLSSIIVEAGNPTYDSRDNCNAIVETATNTLIAGCKTTYISNSVLSIGYYAFDCCYSLTSINIPNSVTSIGAFAFNGCLRLKSITIGNSVTRIGSNAFCNCFSITSITCYATTPPDLGSNVFDDYNLNFAVIPLYVPEQSVEAYKTADQWKKFNVKAIGTEDALPEILTDENVHDGKFMIDGVLYIRKEGRVFDITGQEVH